MTEPRPDSPSQQADVPAEPPLTRPPSDRDSAEYDRDDKLQQLRQARAPSLEPEILTTNQGTRISDNHHSLKAGSRGPTLLEDFVLREKITHFDHERIPERVVHARGEGAHGYFELSESLAPYTTADFLQQVGERTPVFVRFSTVVGSRGSADTVRDVRGFAVKFYTRAGNFDLVGNNIPVFFIQDAIKFPDLVHALKPEPHAEIPQASSAHDTFWDFASLMPESMHMLMWLMSDRALPRSHRMMEGFGVHTFRLINAQGQSTFVKFHWKPLLGVHGLVWDEAQQLAGIDPDFHRRDLWEAIAAGAYPQWDLGLQLFTEQEALGFDFDALDATKLIPEELVPVRRVGRLTLNRNPDNFFTATEQVAFHPGHLVPGIDFTDDPLLQGRLFSYTDTQLLRLGGPNFHQLPINRSVCPVHNFLRDGLHRSTMDSGQVAYEPNSLITGTPIRVDGTEAGGFRSYPQDDLWGAKQRVRADSFTEHDAQARLFWNSQSRIEKHHIAQAFEFELSKVNAITVRKRMVAHLALIDADLAECVASGVGLELDASGTVREAAAAPTRDSAERGSSERGLAQRDLAERDSAERDLAERDSAERESRLRDTRGVRAADGRTWSQALSMVKPPWPSEWAQPGPDDAAARIDTRKVALLASDGVDEEQLDALRVALQAAGALPRVVAPRLGVLRGAGGSSIGVDHTWNTMPAVAFDAAYVPGGEDSVMALLSEDAALNFVAQTYRHGKSLAATGQGVRLLEAVGIDIEAGTGVVCDVPKKGIDAVAAEFIAAMALHRHWDRHVATPPAGRDRPSI